MWYDEIAGAQPALKARPDLKDLLWEYVFDLSQKVYR
jgi:hypothetical protein